MSLTAVDYGTMVMLLILVVASLAMYFIKDLLHAVIVYGAYTLIMALVWLQMNTPPDIAITEAAAGIAMTVLMMVVISRTARKED